MILFFIIDIYTCLQLIIVNNINIIYILCPIVDCILLFLFSDQNIDVRFQLWLKPLDYSTHENVWNNVYTHT